MGEFYEEVDPMTYGCCNDCKICQKAQAKYSGDDDVSLEKIEEEEKLAEEKHERWEKWYKKEVHL